MHIILNDDQTSITSKKLSYQLENKSVNVISNKNLFQYEKYVQKTYKNLMKPENVQTKFELLELN